MNVLSEESKRVSFQYSFFFFSSFDELPFLVVTGATDGLGKAYAEEVC